MTPLDPKLVLLADDDASIVTVLTRAMQARGYQVKSTDCISDIDAWVAQGLGHAVVTDVLMPRGNGLEGLARWHAKRPQLPVIVMSAHNTLLSAARSQELGAVSFLPKPFDLDTLMAALDAATQPVPQPVASKAAEEGVVRINDTLVLVGKSPAMQQLFRELASLIGNDLTVLITGESGTGKDRIARALHALGKRKDHAFIALNMAAIPKEQIETTLFGNATQAGAFENARGGTLFLDEIGDMPMEAQTRLLHALEDTARDVRVIAATHRDLQALVAQGAFREDLFYRLHVLPLHVPALRERKEDIALLAEYFMSQASSRGLMPRTLEPSALAVLGEHGWPGNVRELQYLVYRLCAIGQSPTVSAADVTSLLQTKSAMVLELKPLTQPVTSSIEASVDSILTQYFTMLSGTLPAAGLYDRLLAQLERPLILHTLRATHGNQIRAAEVLGINRNTLRKKMRELGIEAKAGWKDAA